MDAEDLAPGWYPDSTGRHEYRYWDGGAWTDHVSDAGITGHDSPSVSPPASRHPQSVPAAPTAPPPKRQGRRRTNPWLGGAVVLAAIAIAGATAAVDAWWLDDEESGESQEAITRAETKTCAAATDGERSADLYSESSGLGPLAGPELPAIAASVMQADAGIIEKVLTNAPDGMDNQIRVGAEQVARQVNVNVQDPAAVEALGQAFATLSATCRRRAAGF